MKYTLSFLSLLVALFFIVSCSGGSTEQADSSSENTQEEPAMDDMSESTQPEESDAEAFSKSLSLQGYTFEVTAEDEGDYSVVNINTTDLENESEPMTMEAEGTVSDAQIEDLDSDGYPEVIIFSHSGEDDYGHVYGVTVLSGRSLGMVSLPGMSPDSELAQGYQGHDEFTLIETNLGRRFPIYENGNDSGKIRQITYTLQNGENGKVFVQNNVSEY